MEKKAVIRHLITYLEEELRELPPSDAPAAKPDPRRAEIESLLTMYRFLPSREYGADEPIIPTSLVALRVRETLSYAFIAPRGGGFITTVDGVPLQVLTDRSPLGEALLGRKTGDRVAIEVRGEARDYLIVSSA